MSPCAYLTAGWFRIFATALLLVIGIEGLIEFVGAEAMFIRSKAKDSSSACGGTDVREKLCSSRAMAADIPRCTAHSRSGRSTTADISRDRMKQCLKHSLCEKIAAPAYGDMVGCHNLPAWHSHRPALFEFAPSTIRDEQTKSQSCAGAADWSV